MELSTLRKRLQEHFSDGLVLVVGSGLSCAEGVPGMHALGEHLVTQIPKTLSPQDFDLWQMIYPEIQKEGLEAALLRYAPTASLEASIVQSSGEFIASAEAKIIAEVFSRSKILRLTKLLPHLIVPDSGIPIITTNYDRLVEVACEEGGLGVDTMFNGHFAARLEPEHSHWSFCRSARVVNRVPRVRFAKRAKVFKPHGSLDWYHRDGDPVRYAGSLPLPRLIITPGLNKFRSGYESPFDKHRDKGNESIDKAQKFLIIGYGFNDDHLETHLTPRIKSGVGTLIITHTLSEKARTIALSYKNVIALDFQSRTISSGTRVIADGAETDIPEIDLWDLDGLVKGVLSA